MDAVPNRFSCPRSPRPCSAIQCEGQNAKITGFYVPRKKNVLSHGGLHAACQESLHLGIAERMLVAFAVGSLRANGPRAGVCRQTCVATKLY
jgi:hypothetical protein